MLASAALLVLVFLCVRALEIQAYLGVGIAVPVLAASPCSRQADVSGAFQSRDYYLLHVHMSAALEAPAVSTAGQVLAKLGRRPPAARVQPDDPQPLGSSTLYQPCRSRSDGRAVTPPAREVGAKLQNAVPCPTLTILGQP